MSDELNIKKPDLPLGIQWVTFEQTKDQHDPVPNLRIYPTQQRTSFNLQIRGTCPLGNGKIARDLKPRNLIATIGLTIEDMRQIADYVKTIDS